MRCTEPAYKGFELMATKGISSIAIVDETGCLIHNISASDVRLYFGTEETKPDTGLSSEMEDYLARRQVLIPCVIHQTRCSYPV